MRPIIQSRRWSALLTVIALIGAFRLAAAAPPPGPPWPVNYARAATRAASDAPAANFAYAEVEANAEPIGVAVTTSAAIAKPKMGNQYQLYYQLRLHTKKGEEGPLLGTKESPGGKAFLVRQVTCEYDWIEFYEKFDVTRADLSSMTNLPPAGEGSASIVLIRVEPQLYDVAEKKYLTVPKTPAAILVATVGRENKVWKLQSLSGYLIEKSGIGWDPKPALDALAGLDEFSTLANHVEDAILTVLTAKDVSVEKKVLYIRAIPSKTLHHSLSAFNLKQTLEQFASGPDPDLKAAAQKKLSEE